MTTTTTTTMDSEIDYNDDAVGHDNNDENDSDNDESDNYDDIDDNDNDAFEAFIMRYKLCEHDFRSEIWPCLKQAGWKYVPNNARYSYVAPTPCTASTSPCITSNEEEKELGERPVAAAAAAAAAIEPSSAEVGAAAATTTTTKAATPKTAAAKVVLGFESSNDLCKYLDLFSMEDIVSNLQLCRSRTRARSLQQQQQESVLMMSSNNDEDDEKILRGKKLRRDLLRLISKRLLSQADKRREKEEEEEEEEGKEETKMMIEEDENKESNNNDNTNSKSRGRGRPRRSCTKSSGVGGATRNSASTRRKNNSRNNNYSSVTATEKGTDLYLHKNNKVGRSSSSSSNKSTSASTSMMMIDDNNDPFHLNFPSNEECGRIGKEYNANTNNSTNWTDKEQFNDWKFLLSTNHSLLLYGAGSKRQLLNQFVDECLNKEGYVVTINGYDPDVTVTKILDLLVLLFLDDKEPPPQSSIANADGGGEYYAVVGTYTPWRAQRTVVERAICISRAIAYEASDTLVPVYLVIHNIDGDGLRNSLAQQALSQLLVNSTVENGVASIRLVASIDHVDAPVAAQQLSCSTVSSNFNWIYKQVNTYQLYETKEEIVGLIGYDDNENNYKNNANARRGNSRMNAASRRKAVQANMELRYLEILRTLAPRHTEVVQILARLQLQLLSSSERNKTSSNATNNNASSSRTSNNNKKQQRRRCWVDYKKFLKACIEGFAVTKDSQLRTLLSELKDHALVETTVIIPSADHHGNGNGNNVEPATSSGSEGVCIPFDDTKLREIIAYKK